jgi:hypothetical protein
VVFLRLFVGSETSPLELPLPLVPFPRRSQITSAGSSRVACFKRSNRRSAPRRTTSVTGLDFFAKALFIVRAVEMLYSRLDD